MLGLNASQVLTRGGAEGRLILELAPLRHLGVTGFIVTCLRVWGMWGGRAGGEGTRGQQARLTLPLADPLSPVSGKQCPESCKRRQHWGRGIVYDLQGQAASRERQNLG